MERSVPSASAFHAYPFNYSFYIKTTLFHSVRLDRVEVRSLVKDIKKKSSKSLYLKKQTFYLGFKWKSYKSS